MNIDESETLTSNLSFKAVQNCFISLWDEKFVLLLPIFKNVHILYHKRAFFLSFARFFISKKYRNVHLDYGIMFAEST